MKQSNTCGFETIVMSVECLALDIRNPQVHIPTASSEAVGLSTYKAFYTSTWPLEVKPFFTNHVIHIDGDHATGTCSLENRATRDGESWIGAGRLHDTYEKADGEWKFTSRRVEMFYFVPLAQGWANADSPAKL